MSNDFTFLSDIPSATNFGAQPAGAPVAALSILQSMGSYFPDAAANASQIMSAGTSPVSAAPAPALQQGIANSSLSVGAGADAVSPALQQADMNARLGVLNGAATTLATKPNGKHLHKPLHTHKM